MKKNTGSYNYLFVAASLAFFVSGFTALGYQVLWQRILSQEIGVDSISVAIIVSIFMLGLGIGTYIGKSLASTSRIPVTIYAIAEIMIAIFAFFSPEFLRLEQAAQLINHSYIASAIVYGTILLIPTALMGIGVPLIVAACSRDDSNISFVFGFLYGLNILGAFAGTIIASFFAIELLGLDISLKAFALVNVFVPIIAFPFILKELRDSDGLPRFSFIWLTRGSKVRMRKNWVIAILVYGFATLSLEILFFRYLSNYFGSVSIVFPLLLAAYLLNMSIGEMLGGFLSKFWIKRSLITIVLTLIGLTLLIGFLSITEKWLIDIGVTRSLAKNPKDYFDLFGILILFLTPVLFFSALLPLFMNSIESQDGLKKDVVG